MVAMTSQITNFIVEVYFKNLLEVLLTERKTNVLLKVIHSTMLLQVILLLSKLLSKIKTEAHSKPCQTSKIEYFVKTVNGWKPWTIFTEMIYLKFSKGSEYATVKGTIEKWKKDQVKQNALRSDIIN